MFSLLLLLACNEPVVGVNPIIKNDSSKIERIDTVKINEPIEITSDLPDSLVKDGYVEETKELASVIEKKYGVQWDFCDCIVKSDSINKIMSDLEGVSDDEIDFVFARWEVIDKHCKELITAPNTTPDERKRYSRKVKKCLKNAGIN